MTIEVESTQVAEMFEKDINKLCEDINAVIEAHNILVDENAELKNIIKEVREWANKTIFYFDFEEEITKHAFDLLYTKQGQELLEILDKAGDEK